MEGKVIRINNEEEPPTITIEFENGEVVVYTVDDILSLYTIGTKVDENLVPQPFTRD